MTKSRGKSLKIISATVMCVFSLFVTVLGAYAWFVAKRTEYAEGDNFPVIKKETAVVGIEVHDFYGMCDDGVTFGFNPVANHSITWSDKTGSDVVGFTMGAYSVDNPHHPVLLLMTVNGTLAHITLKTDYPYIAGTMPGGELGGSSVFATYAALNVAANKVEGNDGKYFEVTHDEHQTASYTENSTSYYVTTRYQYHHSTGEFELVWTSLGQSNNPLSSVIQSNYFLFEDNPTDNADTYKTQNSYFLAEGRAEDGVTYYTRSGSAGSYTYTPDPNVSSGSDLGYNHYVFKSYVPVSSNFSTPTATFVSFGNGGNPIYSKEALLFDGDTNGYAYLGIILDYYPTSLEYIYSAYLGHQFLNNRLTFKCDWSMYLS